MIQRLGKLIIVASAIIMITACGGGGGTGGGTGTVTKSGTINFIFDGVDNTYYSLNTNNGTDIINSATFSRNVDGTEIWIFAYPELNTVIDKALNIKLTFPTNIITEDTYSIVDCDITYILRNDWYSTDTCTINVTKVTDLGTTMHIEGSINNEVLSHLQTGTTKTISAISFSVDLDEFPEK